LDNDETVLRSSGSQSQPGERVVTIRLEDGICFSYGGVSLPLRIGRGADCNICIPSGHISRHHCELFVQNGRVCLKDTSSNGTTVNGREVHDESALLEDRTTIFLAGEVKIAITVREGAIETISHDLESPDAGDESDSGSASERRGEDRLSLERRSSISVVDFERREEVRRHGPRRVVQRH